MPLAFKAPWMVGDYQAEPAGDVRGFDVELGDSEACSLLRAGSFLSRPAESPDESNPSPTRRFDALDAGFGALDARFGALDARFFALDARFVALVVLWMLVLVLWVRVFGVLDARCGLMRDSC